MDKDKNCILGKTEKSKKVQLISVDASLVDYARKQAIRELVERNEEDGNVKSCR